MKTSQTGINLIKEFEGCVLHAYKDPIGVWTIGYGHTVGVKQGQKLTQKQAEEYLKSDLKIYENGVTNTKLKLNQNQFDALVSFAYNCGVGSLKTLISGRTLGQIAEALLLYNKAGGKTLAGLVRRRKAEKELFEKKVTTSTPVKEGTKKPTQSSYTVRSGDTLSDIASRFNVTTKKLIELNGIKNANVISIGQVLKLTGSVPTQKIYKVKSGDTLSGIAKKYKTTTKKLQDKNGIKDANKIQIGQQIKI